MSAIHNFRVYLTIQACLCLALLFAPGLSYGQPTDTASPSSAPPTHTQPDEPGAALAQILARLPELRQLLGYSSCRTPPIEGSQVSTCEIACPLGSAAFCMRPKFTYSATQFIEKEPAKCWCANP